MGSESGGEEKSRKEKGESSSEDRRLWTNVAFELHKPELATSWLGTRTPERQRCVDAETNAGLSSDGVPAPLPLRCASCPTLEWRCDALRNTPHVVSYRGNRDGGKRLVTSSPTGFCLPFFGFGRTRVGLCTDQKFFHLF